MYKVKGEINMETIFVVYPKTATQNITLFREKADAETFIADEEMEWMWLMFNVYYHIHNSSLEEAIKRAGREKNSFLLTEKILN